MSNLYSDQSLNNTDMAIEMAMTLARVPLELRRDMPVCSNVLHLKSLMPSVAGASYAAIDLLGQGITDVINDRRWRFDIDTENDERVSFISLARAYIAVVGEDNITYGMHSLSAYQTLLADGLLADIDPRTRQHSDDVTRAVVGGDDSGDEFFRGETFLAGTTRTRYRTTDHVLPALSVLYAAGVIGTHRDIEPQDAVSLARLPGPVGFYYVYRAVYGTPDVSVPDASAWQFSLAPIVLALAAATFVMGAREETERIIDEVGGGVFTSGFASERPDLHFEAMRDRAVSMIEFYGGQDEDSDGQ